MTLLLSARPLQEEIRAKVAEKARWWQEQGALPRLDLVLCGDQGSSAVYAEGLARSGRSLGMAVEKHTLPETICEGEYMAQLQRIGADPAVHGLLPLVPLPAQIRREVVATAIPTCKDVDAISPHTLGLFFSGRPTFIPSTARAVDELLSYYQISLAGRRVVIIGRGPSAGRAIAWMCLQRDATVTVCHSKTIHLSEIARQAEILICVAGQPEMVGAAFIRPGAVVVDVGMTWMGGRLVGDVCFPEVEPLASAITPVPGGVGPITTAVLLEAAMEATALNLPIQLESER
ncbi:MAG: bifunctional 5,10-methylenetetrahydrofolate dehydrogenase/5,10-methenyltetrahydrofolate cyclohydrolase [bacterium]